MNISLKKTALFGVFVGSIMSIAVTVYVTLWEWIENPGGIFHDSNGTHWRFVFDTAVSWLWPTFLTWMFVGIFVHLLYAFVRRKSGSELEESNR